MLAARDQENLVHGHQAAAAAKPLNQGNRQLQPKTPGNKPSKTPFISLNDENGTFGNSASMKTALRADGKGNENLITVTRTGGFGNKNNFVTPVGQRPRAPLGLKTNNPKTKVVQTPAQAPNNVKPNKTIEKSAITRTAKPRASHAEIAKLKVFGDNEPLEEREIEYMPPPAKDLPNLPDDMPHEINLSMFDNGGLMRGYGEYFSNLPDEEGLSYVQRRIKHQEEIFDKVEKRTEALILREFESTPVPCMHFPDCQGDECKDSVEARKKAEEKYQNTLALLETKTTPIQKKTTSTKRPPTVALRKAAMNLSQPKTRIAIPKHAANPSALKSSLHTSVVTSKTKTPPPTNPSSMRHTAATAASKTTMGYSKGRAASATLRKAITPQNNDKEASDAKVPDVTLAPAAYIRRYGDPPFGSDMWTRCRDLGCFDKDEGWEESWNRSNSRDLFLEEAEQDFELIL